MGEWDGKQRRTGEWRYCCLVLLKRQWHICWCLLLLYSSVMLLIVTCVAVFQCEFGHGLTGDLCRATSHYRRHQQPWFVARWTRQLLACSSVLVHCTSQVNLVTGLVSAIANCLSVCVCSCIALHKSIWSQVLSLLLLIVCLSVCCLLYTSPSPRD